MVVMTFLRPFTVLPQSVLEISNKFNAEDSESKNNVENSESMTPVDTATEPVKSPIIQKTDTQQPRPQPARNPPKRLVDYALNVFK